jgi:ferredoxin
MVEVDFTESAAGPGRTFLAEGRARLLDLCDEARAPVEFGCRAARCTTCRVQVLEGAERLLPPGEEEAELLHEIAAPADVRLACQAVVAQGSGRLRLRWIGPVVA